MTKEEARKFYEENEKPKVYFVRYCKYSFTFSGNNDFMKLTLCYGGNADDIYRYEIDTAPIELPKDLDSLLDFYSLVVVENVKNGDKYEEYGQ